MIKRPHKAILLNLDPRLVEQIDDAARLIYGTRTRFLTEAALRSVRFFQQHEKPVVLRLREQAYRQAGAKQ